MCLKKKIKKIRILTGLTFYQKEVEKICRTLKKITFIPPHLLPLLGQVINLVEFIELSNSLNV